ncbi:hypothetical protein ES708_28317 [subsurface metagenome]
MKFMPESSAALSNPDSWVRAAPKAKGVTDIPVLPSLTLLKTGREGFAPKLLLVFIPRPKNPAENRRKKNLLDIFIKN